MAELQLDLASNWANIYEILLMINECRKMKIRFAKLQLFKKEQVRDVYWNKIITKEMAATAFKWGKDIGVEVYFTPCYPEAVDICREIGVNYYKIRYKDRNNAEIFEKLQDIYVPIFVSCENPKDTLYYGMRNAIFLYCIHKYPASFDDYNIFQALAYCSGVSDHTPDMEMFDRFECYFKYWEIHAARRKGTIEEKWSKRFDEIKKSWVV